MVEYYSTGWILADSDSCVGCYCHLAIGNSVLDSAVGLSAMLLSTVLFSSTLSSGNVWLLRALSHRGCNAQQSLLHLSLLHLCLPAVARAQASTLYFLPTSRFDLSVNLFPALF